jgi:8-oxo-dGTP pyrophosphatase MutT (NUDIX family)
MSYYLLQLRAKAGHDLLLLPSAAVIVHDDETRLLLCLHNDKRIWVAPGGLIEPGEQPGDAAVRETWEETGLLVELTGLFGAYGGPDLIIDYPNGDKAAYIATVFRGRVIGGSLRADGEETLDVRYFTREEFDRIPHSRWLDAAAPSLFQRDAPAHYVSSAWRPY